MSIWITGDCHSDFYRFTTEVFPEQLEMTREDIVIICGDFGGIWYQEDSVYIKRENMELDFLESRPFTTVFVDGNHEHFDRLNSFPVKEWNGGLVHEIRPHVLHLMRGEVYAIEDKKFFAFGGASSHDISDGILDGNYPNWKEKAKELDKQGKYMYRIKGLSWWPQELPSEEEMQNGINNLKKHDNKVDFIITHSPSASVIALLGHELYDQDILTRYLEDIRCTIEYTRMFSGHMHVDKQINDKDILLYEQIIRIN